MSKLNETDVQGFVLRGYNMPFGRYVFLEVLNAAAARKFVDQLLPYVTTGQYWDCRANRNPPSTLPSPTKR